MRNSLQWNKQRLSRICRPSFWTEYEDSLQTRPHKSNLGRLLHFVSPLFEANAESVYNANVPNTDSSLSPLYAVMSWECGVRNSPGLLVISSLIMAPFWANVIEVYISLDALVQIRPSGVNSSTSSSVVERQTKHDLGKFVARNFGPCYGGSITTNGRRLS